MTFVPPQRFDALNHALGVVSSVALGAEIGGASCVYVPRDELVIVDGKVAPKRARDTDAAIGIFIETIMARDRRADLEASARRHEAAIREQERRQRERRGELTNPDRAARWLARAEPAIAGRCGKGSQCNSYNRRAFSVAASVGLGFDLSHEEALRLLSEWNRGNSPPMPPKALAKIVADAMKRGRVARGARLERRAA